MTKLSLLATLLPVLFFSVMPVSLKAQTVPALRNQEKPPDAIAAKPMLSLQCSDFSLELNARGNYIGTGSSWILGYLFTKHDLLDVDFQTFTPDFAATIYPQSFCRSPENRDVVIADFVDNRLVEWKRANANRRTGNADSRSRSGQNPSFLVITCDDIFRQPESTLYPMSVFMDGMASNNLGLKDRTMGDIGFYIPLIVQECTADHQGSIFDLISKNIPR